MTPKRMTIEDLATMVMRGFQAMDARFERIENRLDAIESRLSSLEARVSEVEFELEQLKNEFKEIKNNVLTRDVDFIELKTRVKRLEKRLGLQG